MDEDIQSAFCRQRDHLERTVNSLRMRLAKSAEEHDRVYVKIMKASQKAKTIAWTVCLTAHYRFCLLFAKTYCNNLSLIHMALSCSSSFDLSNGIGFTLQENVTLISEINELRKELLSERTRVKEYKAQLATIKKSNKSRPNSQDGARKEPNHEQVN